MALIDSLKSRWDPHNPNSALKQFARPCSAKKCPHPHCHLVPIPASRSNQGSPLANIWAAVVLETAPAGLRPVPGQTPRGAAFRYNPSPPGTHISEVCIYGASDHPPPSPALCRSRLACAPCSWAGPGGSPLSTWHPQGFWGHSPHRTGPPSAFSWPLKYMYPERAMARLFLFLFQGAVLSSSAVNRGQAYRPLPRFLVTSSALTQ